jgi:hypothetical protein
MSQTVADTTGGDDAYGNKLTEIDPAGTETDWT